MATPEPETVGALGNTVQIYASSREQYDHRRAELEQQLPLKAHDLYR